MPKPRHYKISPGLAEDILDVTRQAKTSPVARPGTPGDDALQELPFPHELRLHQGTYTDSTWAIGTSAQVTKAGVTNTVAVTNLHFPLSGCTTSIRITYTRQRGTMVATMINLTDLPGYNAASDPDSIQVLGHQSGCLTWFGIKTCS